ncbi:condensation domain-containing protein, partial [Sinomicrobium oceani]|uniref:condensation domain-containing protein n=1 Tax=Sinomicrobium oceani TaxID=1150368 RepID=UPI00227C0CA8
LESLLDEDINRPFDLGSQYPIRVKFYHIGGDRTVLLINTHHIASDGWSMEIFQRELYAYYQAYVNNDEAFNLSPLEIQYKDYAIWQRAYLRGEILEEQLDYWKDKLSGYQALELPTDRPRPKMVDYTGDYGSFALSKATSDKLRGFAKKHGTTLHTVLLSATNILLGKYSGQDDIVTGSVIANRHYRQTQDLIGFFVNTQVNRALLDRAQSFEQLVQQAHQEQVAAQLHQDIPFERLVDELGVDRDTSRHPIFQVSFTV